MSCPICHGLRPSERGAYRLGDTPPPFCLGTPECKAASPAYFAPPPKRLEDMTLDEAVAELADGGPVFGTARSRAAVQLVLDALASKKRAEEQLAMLPPLALAEVIALLTHGAARYGAASAAETGGGQTAMDHARHRWEHLRRHDRVLVPTEDPNLLDRSRDPETGRYDLAHGVTRGLLELDLLLRDEGADHG